MIGSVLDKYEVLQKLGEGATATVYRGRHTTIGKDVAIKVLHPHLSASSRYRERFNREARAVGRLSHQNIVSILDYSGSAAEECYIVTELVDGQTLLGILQQQGRIPSEITALIGMDLAAALSVAHAEGVVHRDLKPENIMIRRDGRLKLMDFGVARVMDEGSMTMEGALLGSPAYMSPQQALDEPLDGRSDLFSLGTVLFHAVTGHVPYSGTNPSVILRNIIDGNRPEVLELAPEVSPSLAAVIDKLMRPKPEDRYQRAEEVGQALAACLLEVGLGAEHPVFNLRNYIVEPNGLGDQLSEYLKKVLLERGRERLAAKDHLGALQLLNRLLAIDEENTEVISLIQSLHQAPEPVRKPWRAFAAAGLVLAIALVAWVLYPKEPVLMPEVPPPVSEVSLPLQTPPAPPPSDNTVPPATPSPLNHLAPASTPALLSPPRSIEPHPPGTRPPVENMAVAPAEITITCARWAEVLVDGKSVGFTRKGPSSEWVGGVQNPLKLAAGTHTLLLRNDFSEPYREEITVGSGEKRNIRVELRRLPVSFTVNPRMPRDCAVTVGTTHYASVRDFDGVFKLTEPASDMPVIFDCPLPVGRISTTVGPTSGGESLIIPTSLPADRAP